MSTDSRSGVSETFYFHRRGWLIFKLGSGGRWRWAHNGRFLRIGACSADPPCRLCGRPPTSEGYDACLGELRGAVSACCGHGVTEPHVTYAGLGPRSPRGRQDLLGRLWSRQALSEMHRGSMGWPTSEGSTRHDRT
jgi:hypothetical protein